MSLSQYTDFTNINYSPVKIYHNTGVQPKTWISLAYILNNISLSHNVNLNLINAGTVL